MDALRMRTAFRFGPVVEWLVAAAFLCATVAVGSLIVQELRGAGADPSDRHAASARHLYPGSCSGASRIR